VTATRDLLRQTGKNFARNQRKQGAVTLCVEATPHGEIAMNKIIVGAIALAATASLAFAAEDGSLTTKAMEDQPGTMGGSTAMPNAKASDGNLTTKAMQDQPGTMGGSTSTPTAKPDSGSLSEKAMKDQPGTK
jgi:hypothetical protein